MPWKKKSENYKLIKVDILKMKKLIDSNILIDNVKIHRF